MRQRAPDMPALADDSGLCVESLNGAPGVFSARFAGESATDQSNNAELLRRLAGVTDRQAHYTCVLVAVRSADDAEPLIVDARWYGEIAQAPRGSGGFGYDPLFYLSEPRRDRRRARSCAQKQDQPSRPGSAGPGGKRWPIGVDVLRLSRSSRSRRQRSVADVSTYLRPGSINLPALPPLSLYIHYPWCVRKCPYCDFNSHEASPQGAPEGDYLDALRADLEAALPLVWGRRIISVFVGGGTPSLMSAQAVDRLLSDVRALLPLALDCEITLEANPGTFEAERFAAYRASGVNRLSIGIQSFDEQKLKALGRIHDRAQAFAAIEIAHRHFENFNLDLMYALPGQSLAELQDDVESCARCAAAAPVALSADVGTEHRVRQTSAGAT